MTSVILLAAGSGTRSGFTENKILKELNGLPVLSYSLSAFSPYADEIIVACRKEDEKKIIPLLSPYPQAVTVLGGSTRAESALFALRKASGDTVLLHDAARPFVTEEVIEDCIKSVMEHGSGIAALPVTDTTALCSGGIITSVPDRRSVYSIQTPQGFLKKELLLAYEKAFAEGRQNEFTDDSGVYAAYVCPPRLSLGDSANKKLTYAADFSPVERVGFGVDTHRFETPEDGALPFINFIVLGGVKIPSPKRLVAHSDGDVLVHALMDALLSAAGLRDIGYYFPDTDEKYAGADSTQLLEEVVKLVAKQGYRASNVSLSVLAEFPRLSPYIGEMKTRLAKLLSLTEGEIGIAAGTNEKLGYVGEGKGITCYASVLLKSNRTL